MIGGNERLTLVVGTANNGPDWTPSSVLHVETLSLARALVAQHDIQRLILDASNSTEAFLHLLADLPEGIAGDVMLVHRAGAFLSATGRGGDRVLYKLSPADVDFYLETHGLAEYARIA